MTSSPGDVLAGRVTRWRVTPKPEGWAKLLADVVTDAIEALHDEGSITPDSVRGTVDKTVRGGTRIKDSSVRNVVDAATDRLDRPADENDRLLLRIIARKRLSKYLDGQLPFLKELQFVASDHQDNGCDPEEASARIERALVEFLVDAQAWRSRQTLAAMEERAFDEAPVARSLQVSVGAGKTRAMIEAIARSRLKAWIVIPRINLGEEIERELRARGVDVLLFRGRKRNGRDGAPMCHKPDDAARVLAIGAAVRPTLCESGKKDADGVPERHCEFWTECRYVAQFRQEPRVLIFPQNHLWLPILEREFGLPDVLIIDESLGVPTNEQILTADSAASVARELSFIAAPLRLAAKWKELSVPAARAAADLERVERAAGAVRAITDLIATHSGPVTREAVEHVGFDDPGDGFESTMRALIRRPGEPGGPLDDDVLDTAGRLNKAVSDAVGVVREVVEFVAGGNPVSGRLSVADGVLTHSPFWPIRDAYRVPTLLFDATPPPAAVMARALGRDAEALPAIDVRWSEHATLEYVIGASASATALGIVEGKGKPGDGARFYGGLRTIVDHKSFEFDRDEMGGADVALFMQKTAIVRLFNLGASDGGAAWIPRPNVRVENFGNLTGRNDFEDVACLIVAGRQMPKPEVVEAQSARVTGAPVKSELCGNWRRVTRKIPLADGRAVPVRHVEHRDPLCEALRWRICEGELVQAIGRARTLRRGSNRPVSISIIGNVPLPIVAHKISRWADVAKPGWSHAAKMGIVPFSEADALALMSRIVLSDREARRIADWRREFLDLPGSREMFLYINGAAIRFGVSMKMAALPTRMIVQRLCDLSAPERWPGPVAIGWGGRPEDHKILAKVFDAGPEGITAKAIADNLRKSLSREEVAATLAAAEAAGLVCKKTRKPMRGPTSELWLYQRTK